MQTPNGCRDWFNPLLFARSAVASSPTCTVELQHTVAQQITNGQTYSGSPRADRCATCPVALMACAEAALRSMLCVISTCDSVCLLTCKTVASAVEAPARPSDTAAFVEGGKQTPSYVSLSAKYAIVDAAGTQMLLEEGRWYTCNRLQVGCTAKFKGSAVSVHRMTSKACLSFCCKSAMHRRLNLAAPSILAEYLQPKRMAHSQVADHIWIMSQSRQRY